MRTTWMAVASVAGLMMGMALGGCRQRSEVRGDEVYGETTVIAERDGVGDASALFTRSSSESVTTVMTVERLPVNIGERPYPVQGEVRGVFVERGGIAPLKVNVAAPPMALICEDIPLRFLITNQSGLDVPDARFAATLPPGLTTVDGRTSVEMNIGTVVANETREVIVPVRADRPGRFQSLASVVEGPGARPAEVVETAMLVGRPILSLSLEASEPSVNSNEVVVTMTVSNTGTVSALDTALEGAMSPNTNAIDRGGATPRLDRLVWDLGDIAPGERKQVRVRVNAFEPGVVTGSVTAVARCAERAEASFRKEVR